MKPIVIVGSGITGLTIARELSKSGKNVVVIEKENSVGGLARSFHYEEFSFDIGPHRFHSDNKEIIQYIERTLNNETVKILRYNGVYFRSKYHSWPIQLKTMIKLPLHLIISVVWDLFKILFQKRRKTIITFEDYIINNFGLTLYNTFFKDYTEKFLNIKAQDTHVRWAEIGMKNAAINEHVNARNIFEIIKIMLKSFSANKMEYLYTKKGIGLFTDKLSKDIEESGGVIKLNSEITDIKCSSNRIEQLTVNNNENIVPEKVIWTAPIDTLCGKIGISSNGLYYRSLILYNIELDSQPKKKYQWCYFGDKDIVFNRISDPSLFNANMVPKGKYSICVEVTCQEGDKVWGNPDNLIPKIKEDLKKVGFIKRIEDINKIHIERVANAYPCYNLKFQTNLQSVNTNLSKYNNLILAGRTGLFWYNNMDGSIQNGLEIIQQINQEYNS